MNNKSITHATRLFVAFLLLAQSAGAIKIVVPDQYQDQVDAIKKAERAERERELQGDVQEAADEGISIAGEKKPAEKPKVDADEFLVQSVVEATATATAYEGTLAADEGLVSGQIIDKETGEPLSGVAILVEGADIATVTADDGRYSLGPVTAGQYTLSIIKSGYIEANVTDYNIAGGEVSVFPFALPPRPAEMSDEVYELQDFTVTAEQANDLMMKLELRMDSNQALEIFSSEDFSKFAASDVGEAIKRLAGVTVQGGKFAVIRGLDERYTSTLLNGAPVPSPDPDKQSVPLDLFPSEIVSNIVVSKTFAPELPANSVGGNILIQTVSYPEELTIKAKSSAGFNDNARKDFYSDGGRKEIGIDFNNLGSTQNAAIAEQYNQLSGRLTPEKDDAGIDREFNLEIGDTTELFGRQLRLFATVGVEKDFRSRIGTEEKRTGRPGIVLKFLNPPLVISEGDLSLGQLTNTTGKYDVTSSQEIDRTTFLATGEYDLDKEGNHTVGFMGFYTEENRSSARFKTNGNYFNYDPDGDGHDLGDILENGITDRLYNVLIKPNTATEAEALDAYFNTSFYEANVSQEIRDLTSYQLSGNHKLEDISEDLQVDWLLSYAETNQEEVASVNVAGFRLPDDFITPGPNYISGSDTDSSVRSFVTPTISWRLNQEEQEFGRLDVSDLYDLGDSIKLGVSGGLSVERTSRDVFQEFYSLDTNFIELEEAETLPSSEDVHNEVDSGKSNWPGVSNSNDPAARTESNRDIDAAYVGFDIKLNKKFEISIGGRYEKLSMTTETIPGSSGSNFFNYDLLRRSSSLAPGDPTDPTSPAFRNAQILGLDDAIASDFVGEIDEDYFLPSVTFNYRFTDEIRLLLAYSETVARPSFKEFTYLTTQDPVDGDFASGNPTLTTSEVVSYDARIEWARPNGDLIALGFFYKEVDDPLEKMILDGSDAIAEIFYNNPNTATLMGVEFEARKTLDFFGDGDNFMKYFSAGGNFTIIDAEVEELDSIRALHEEGFLLSDGTRIAGGFNTSDNFETSRGLVNQPEWIANLYASFDQPDWGTRATVSLFSESDVLDSAAIVVGGAEAIPRRYRESYMEVNFTLSQRITDWLTFSFSVKNLTDSTRRVFYDDEVVPGVDPEREYTLGRTYSFSLTGEF